MTSKINTNIKKRDNPNDVFLTPLALSKTQIDMIDYKDDDIWYDPFKNNGSYYDQFPNNQSENIIDFYNSKNEWSELLYGKDFFAFNKKIDIICSNPPYSLMDKVIKKSIELKPRVISYLIGVNNLTARRIEMLENAGYSLTKIHMCKVFKWFGMSFIVQFEKGGDACMSYDRTVWR
tara:strand:+ start:19 stop:549 length:531 start_codon:yes stop_codon:yes gene_type:complete